MANLPASRSAVLAASLPCAGAGAHQPLFNPGSGTQETAFRVPQPTVSKVITVQGRAGGRDWYALTTGSGFRLDVAVFVSSACDATYRPRLWLVGPGVPVGAGTHYLVLEHGARGGWSFISLAGAEVPGGTPDGRAALGRFARCGA